MFFNIRYSSSLVRTCKNIEVIIFEHKGNQFRFSRKNRLIWNKKLFIVSLKRDTVAVRIVPNNMLYTDHRNRTVGFFPPRVRFFACHKFEYDLQRRGREKRIFSRTKLQPNCNWFWVTVACNCGNYGTRGGDDNRIVRGEMAGVAIHALKRISTKIPNL